MSSSAVSSPASRGDREDVALIERALSGDVRARETLTHRLIPVVRAHVLRAFSKSRDEAEDLCQEAWLALIENDGARLRAFDPDRGASLEGFVGLVTDREVIRGIRQRRALKRGGAATHVSTDDDATTADLSDARATPASVVEARDLADQLAGHLEEQLAPKGLLVLRYVFEDGMSPVDAASVMGTSVQVIYNWQHKIRALSRAFMEDVTR